MPWRGWMISSKAEMKAMAFNVVQMVFTFTGKLWNRSSYFIPKLAQGKDSDYFLMFYIKYNILDVVFLNGWLCHDNERVSIWCPCLP